MSLHDESEKNRIIERIEKYIESDEAKVDNLYFCYKFVENIIINFIIDNHFKERYQIINFFNPEFVYAGISCDNHKTYKI